MGRECLSRKPSGGPGLRLIPATGAHCLSLAADERVQVLRSQLRAGLYDVDSRLEVAIDALLQDVLRPWPRRRRRA